MSRLQTRFEQQGTLSSPKLIGRLVRLLLGIACLNLVWQFSWAVGELLVGESVLVRRGLWLPLILGFILLPPVFNIGFGLNTRRWPQVVILGITLILLVLNHLAESSYVTFGLNSFTLFWLLYVFFHLGVSFILSALIATPGCEMRAIPHAYSLLTGQQYREHFCPGFIDHIDRWERNLGKGKPHS